MEKMQRQQRLIAMDTHVCRKEDHWLKLEQEKSQEGRKEGRKERKKSKEKANPGGIECSEKEEKKK